MTNNKAKRVFNFADQMRIGDIGEADFTKIYEKLEPKKDPKNRNVDFFLNNGKTVELKTDSYDMEKTPNMFMEYETVLKDKTLMGGPWRSKDHKIDFFVYYYMKNKVFFWFDPVSLCKTINKYIKKNKVKPIAIHNKDRNNKGGFKSFGYKIPREVLTEILLKEHKVE